MEDNKNCTGPLMIALQYNDLFDLLSISTSTNTDALPKGRAFTFIKAVQTVNERLVDQNKTESLLFEVILIAKECSEEIKMKIVESVKHYGLEIGKFYFCKKEELINTLQSNKVKLFISTDRDDVCKALHTGIPAALLYDQADHHVLNQLKVILSGEVIGFSEDSLDSLSDFGFSETQIETFKAAKICMKEFAVLIGQMRRRFGHENSPLCTCVLTTWGSRNICATAIKTLREWGLDVDEVYCLAGAPCSPILAVVKPHILWDSGLHNMTDSSAPC
ncbi:cytosolic 5'-nucleotidase 1B [Megalobrama amblycephala]|uniref:cytosolic 5'-nucleotidase 1B n=1 Tax=Megalobrama amblycephala TaxID=75352 RepID=UPI0020147F4C|nr:cytosolic 5'-nucleotidase 1B [Megalobrama amblycephala]XP_048015137.1 cytosolic 5'-nucleotidase 1B [Megalobrama amblycephala]